MGSWIDDWSYFNSSQCWEELFDLWCSVEMNRCDFKGRGRRVASWNEDQEAKSIVECSDCVEPVLWLGSSAWAR